MAVDRGGLQYRIEAEEAFGAEFREFLSLVERSKREVRELRDELQQQARASREVAKSTREAARATRESASINRQAAQDAASSAKAARDEAQARAFSLLALRRQVEIQRAILRPKQQLLQIEERQTAASTALQRVDQRGVAISKRRAAAEADAARSKRRVIDVTAESVRVLEREERALVRSERAERARARSGAEAAATTGARGRPEVVISALDRLAASLNRVADAAARAEARLRGVATAGAGRGGGRGPGFEETTRTLRSTGDELGRTSRLANRAEFSIRRFLLAFGGIFLVFRVARSIADAVRGAIDYASAIENATLGIQAVIASSADVADAQGRQVEGAERFAAAQGEARRQVQLLRRDALRTAATFEELLFGFQTGLPIALARGLSTDFARNFTRLVSQAGAAIGLPQNQLAEEIRSILKGTINPRNTRIAVALGITNEDIRRATEAGELADFLLEKFSQFEVAGAAALSNFSVLVANLRNGVQILLGEGTARFFQEVKEDLAQINRELVQAQAAGPVINPGAVRVVGIIEDGLRAALAQGRALARDLTLDDAALGARLLASIITGVATVGRGFIQGLVDGLRTAAALASTVRSFLAGAGRSIFGDLPTDTFVEIVRLLTRVLVLLVSVRLAIFAIVLPVRVLKTTFGLLLGIVTPLVAGTLKFAKGLGTARGAALLLSAPLIATLGVIGLIVAAWNSEWIGSIRVAGLRLDSVAEIIRVGIPAAVRLAASVFESAWISAIAAVRIAFRKVITFFADSGLAVAETVLEGLALVSDAADSALKDVRKLREDLRRDQDTANENEKRAAEERLAIARKERKEAVAKVAAILAGIVAEDRLKEGITIGEAFAKAIEEANRFFDGLGDGADGIDDTNAGAEKLSRTFRGLNGIIAAGRESLAQQGEVLDRLRQDAEKAQDALELAQITRGLEGVSVEIRRVFQEARTSVRQTTRELDTQVRTLEDGITGLATQEQRLTAATLRETQIRAQAFTELQRIAGQVAENETRIAEERRKVTLLDAASLEKVRQGSVQAAEADRIRAEAAKAIAEEREKEIATLEARAAQILQQSGLDEAAQLRVVDAVRETVRLQGQRLQNERQLNEAVRDRAQLEDQTTAIARTRIQELAIVEGERLRVTNQRLAAEVRAAQLRATFEERIRFSSEEDARRAVVESRARLVLLQSEVDLINQQTAARVRVLQQAREAARTEGEVRDIDLAINEILKERNLLLQLNTLEAGELQRVLAAASQGADIGFADGFKEEIDRLLEEANNLGELGERLAGELSSGLSGALSESIFEALDPNSNKSLSQIFANFGRSLAESILRQLIEIGVLKLLQSLVGGGAGGLSIFGGKAEGGPIPNSPIPRRARPRGIDPRDTTPILAQPGEFMMRLAAVRKYGAEVMEAINRGAIDASSLRGLVGLRSFSRSVNRAPRLGYVDGGLIQSIREVGSRAGGGSVKIVNVNPKEALLEALISEEGQQIILNTGRANPGDYQEIVFGR